MTFRRNLLIFAFPLVLLSCSSPDVEDPENHVSLQEKNDLGSELTCLFAGDIMAHKPNFTFGNFKAIYEDIEPLVKSADLSFANLEAPAAKNLEWATYPQFNMKPSYPDAAIEAGFNVFSLANNHTNDQYLQGIKETQEYFSKKSGVWHSGTKEKSAGELDYCVIEKKGWRVLFVALTEILNRQDFASYINYYPYAEFKADVKKRMISDIQALASTVPHDLFVLSLHSCEEEYKRTLTQGRKDFYAELAEKCSIDVIWANHPHVVKPWEIIESPLENGSGSASGVANENNRKVLVMYANGNTISAQRTKLTYDNPNEERDWTGDGLMVKARFAKSGGKVSLLKAEDFLITTYITPKDQYVIRLLDDDFVHSLKRSGFEEKANYFKERINLLKGNK